MLIYSTNSGSPFGATKTVVGATSGYKRVRKRKGCGIRAKVAERQQQRRRKPRKGRAKKRQVKRTEKRKKTSRTKKKKLYVKNVNFLKKLGLRVKKN